MKSKDTSVNLAKNHSMTILIYNKYMIKIKGGQNRNMISSLYKFSPMLISMTLSMIIYLSIDKKDKLTKKISSYLTIKQEWKACFCVCFAFLSILIIGILGIYIIYIPDYIYFVLTGIIAGIGISIANKISPNSVR